MVLLRWRLCVRPTGKWLEARALGTMLGGIRAILMGVTHYQVKSHDTSDLMYASGFFSILLPHCNLAKGLGIKVKAVHLKLRAVPNTLLYEVPSLGYTVIATEGALTYADFELYARKARLGLKNV